jgi:hypothetical protein
MLVTFRMLNCQPNTAAAAAAFMLTSDSRSPSGMMTRLETLALSPFSSVAPFEHVTSKPVTILAAASHQPATATTRLPAGHLMHSGLVTTGSEGRDGQPGLGSSVFRVVSVLVEKPKEVMAGLALPGQVAVIATGLAQAVLSYLKDLPLAVVMVKPVRPPVAVWGQLKQGVWW